MKKVFLLISLLSLFVFGCNDSQNNDVEQLALIASNKISSLEQSNNQLKEELSQNTEYVLNTTIPCGDYGDWSISNNKVYFPKKAYINDYKGYIKNTDITLRFITFEVPCISYANFGMGLPKLTCENISVWVSLTDSIENESERLYLYGELRLNLDIPQLKVDSAEIYFYGIDYTDISKIDNETLNKIMNNQMEFHF